MFQMTQSENVDCVLHEASAVELHADTIKTEGGTSQVFLLVP